MDLPWGSPESSTFITNVGLVTSIGPHGPNIMAAEWTHHVSYKPGLIAVCIGHHKATEENIATTNEFGVSLASADQNVLASIAGGSSGKEVDKMGLAKDMGFAFEESRHIKPPLVSGAALKAECRAIQIIPLGDHTMFVGEVLHASVDLSKNPVAYHSGTYWGLGEQIRKPGPEVLENIKQLKARWKKSL